MLEALGWRVTRLHWKMLRSDAWLIRLAKLLENQRRIVEVLAAYGEASAVPAGTT